ncbi:hypothetical protein SUDANB126_06985 [Streptomyces sp. enrichment culture]
MLRPDRRTRGCPVEPGADASDSEARLLLPLMNILLQATLTAAEPPILTGRAKRGHRWTGRWREGWPPAC